MSLRSIRIRFPAAGAWITPGWILGLAVATFALASCSLAAARATPTATETEQQPTATECIQGTGRAGDGDNERQRDLARGGRIARVARVTTSFETGSNLAGDTAQQLRPVPLDTGPSGAPT
jgi:hypothetical protein